MLLSVFNRFVEQMMQSIAYQGGPWTALRRDPIAAAYKQAAEMTDLYRARLSDPRTRQAYLSILSRSAEQNFRDRLQALDRQPCIPVPVMARACVGAHVAVLEAWLAGELDGDIEEIARMVLDLLAAGTAWAHGFHPDELGYSTASPADARTPSQPAEPGPRDPQPASTATPEDAAGESQ